MLTSNKKKLAKLVAALALLGTASFGAMAEWTRVSETFNFTAYVDLNSIRQSGHMVKMWSIRDFKSPTASPYGTFLSMRSQDEYDCSNERQRGLAGSLSTERMGGGSVLITENTVGQWRSNAPATYDETFFKIACGIK